MKLARIGWLSALLLAGCQNNVSPFPTEFDQLGAGGAATVYDATSAGYSLPVPTLNQDELLRHLAGDKAFEAQFVSAPAPVNPGLGPVFNNNSCLACHKGDGGGRAPEDGGRSGSLLFRLSLPGTAADGGAVPVPGYGLQLQDSAIFGVQAEAEVRTTYTVVDGTYADGTPYRLRRPTHTLGAPYQPLPDGVLMSPRLAGPVFGLGLLEAWPEASIVSHVDENDRDGDGISGRANTVWDAEAKAPKLGRFGWKANAPTLRHQVAAAYQQDMGLTSPIFPQEAARGQLQVAEADHVELTEALLTDTVFYVQTLGVPARRDVAEPQVVAGAQLFRQAQCAACHLPTATTGAYPTAPSLGYQVIHPYTDLLLHDMGEDLADHRPDYLANGQEWRTPPLWGLGMRKRVQGHEHLLHDGRAEGPEQAILWHGGEAARARQAFVDMTAAERQALVTFLRSL